MKSYDAIYRRLQREGYEAWTGSGYQRAREQLNATLGRLDAARLSQLAERSLSWDAATVPWPHIVLPKRAFGFLAWIFQPSPLSGQDRDSRRQA